MLVGLLWLIAFLNYVDRQALFSVLPSIRRELHISDTQIGLFGTVFLWTYGLCSPLAGFLGDRWARRSVILWSLVLFSAATLFTGWAAGAAMLILLRAGLGISEAMYLPSANALIAGVHSPENRSKAIGIHLSGLNIGAIAGGTLAGYMADHYTWRSPFLLLGIVGWILAGACRSVLPEPPRQVALQPVTRGSFLSEVPSILFKRTVLVVMFSGLCASMAGWVLMSWLPLHLYEKFHLTMAQAAFNGTFYFLGSTAAASIAGSIVSDRWTRRRRDARLRLQTIGLAIFGLALLAASASASKAALLSWLCVAGMGRGLWDCNNMPVFCDVLAPAQWATAYGFFNMANVFGGGLAVFVAGIFGASTRLGELLAIFAAFLTAAAALSWLSVHRFFLREVMFSDRKQTNSSSST
jgi:MFS family permease